MVNQWPFTNLIWVPARAGSPPVYLTVGQGVTENGIVVQPGIRGFDAPTYQFAYTESPGLDGAHLNRVRVPSREVFIPIYIEGNDRGDYLTKKRALLSAMNPLGSFGPGRLFVIEGDSTVRTIDMYYLDGAEGDEGVDSAGFHWCRYGLRFIALDPFFYGSTVEARTFRGDVAELKPFFGTPFFGLNLNKTLSFNGTVTLDVHGDVDSWPVWNIVGPLDSVTFINHSLGQSFQFTYPLLAGQVATIDTTPGKKTVKLDDGTNLWDRLSSNPQLWPVAPYWNEIEITVTGVASATEISLEYLPRYLSA